MKPATPLPLHLIMTATLLVTGIAAGRLLNTIAADYTTTWSMLTSAVAIGGLCFFFTIAAAVLMHIRHKAANWALAATCLLAGMAVITLCDCKEAAIAPHAAKPSAISAFSEQQRDRLTEIYSDNGISGEEKGVVTAMTLGNRDGVSRQLQTAYNRSSAAHVFALSGLHIGILFAFLVFLLPRKRFPTACSLLVIATIWGYAILVGLKASIVRAAVMISIYTLIPMTGRRPTAIATVLATGIFLLAIKPSWLFDIGFQMSFGAVISIVLFYQPVYRLLMSTAYAITPTKAPDKAEANVPGIRKPFPVMNATMHKLLQWICGMSVVSLTAQVAVTIFIAAYFNTFCPWFLLTNCIVSPCAAIIIPTAMVMLILGSIQPYLPFFDAPLALCAYILQNVTHLLNSAVTWIATLPGNFY